MTEQEIRSLLDSICTRLDQGARRAVRTGVRTIVIPGAIGASVALAGCSSDGAVEDPPDTQATADAVTPDAGPVTDLGSLDVVSSDVPEPDLLYAAPIPDVIEDMAGPQPLYAAPAPDAGQEDDVAVVPLYAAPAPDVEEVDAGPDLDAGPAPAYMAPPPDTQEPEEDVIEAVPLYAAPMPVDAN